ncbi:MAG: small subunit ribosomal protein S2 [Verrucomicrobia bacterium]|nr:MAG: small subunit ribosomal protein S2 [Verrucomicrobiota bacterium]
MSTELMTELLEAGVHFGHQSKRWNPKMKPFIFEKRNALHIINLGSTVHQLDAATKFLSALAARGGKVLFVGCKKQAQEAVKEAAQACGQFYVNQRWLGGTLTNMATIRKSVARMTYIETLEKQPEYSKMGNQEISALRREGEKLKRNLEGIRTMEKLPDAMIIIDTVREGIAVAEARRLKIATVAITDTNADPALITYPIAGNDDAIRSIRVVLQKLVDALVSGSGITHAAPPVEVIAEKPQDLSAVSE